MPQWLPFRHMPSDEFIGHGVDIVADHVGLRAVVARHEFHQPNATIHSAMARPISSGESSWT